MHRRAFLGSVAVSSLAVGMARSVLAQPTIFPDKVDTGLFETINRVKDPAAKTPLEKSHSPVITAPAQVKIGEPFVVEVSVGENVHGMSPTHWIEFISLEIGNAPAGRIDFQPRGLLQPKVSFTVVLTQDAAPSGKATLVAHQRCNLHGYWEATREITVA
jgi:superoxide reductase